MRTLTLLATILCATSLHAELPTPTVVRLTAMVSKSIGLGGRVFSRNEAVATELKAQGAFYPTARVTYATSDQDVQADVAHNCCVITSSLSGLSKGAVLALIEEGGKPKFVISKQNMDIFGIKFPDQILRISTFQ